MTLADSIITDAANVFTNTDEFAELVTYHPHQYTGEAARDAREISAVVFRNPVQVFQEDGTVVLAEYEVHVANSNTVGISSDELDTGGDQLELPPRDGKAAERRSILKLLTQDKGMLVLACQ